jgi:hypothetical protein
MTGVVTGARSLDLNHLGTEIGEQLRAPRACKDPAEV